MSLAVRSRRAVALLGGVAVLLTGCAASVAGVARPAVTDFPAAVSSRGSPPPTITPPGPPTAVAPPLTPNADSTPAPSTPDVDDVRSAHDSAIDPIMSALAQQLMAGNRTKFLAPFEAPLTHRVSAWFSNTRSLGVSNAEFRRIPGFYPEVDQPNLFTRRVALGIRTPYDDADSLPDITYSVTMTKTAAGWHISAWSPEYVTDPMNCDCTMNVAHRGNLAVVSPNKRDLAGWPAIALQRGSEGVDWLQQHLTNSSLAVPAGEVIFLADSPYRWFLNIDGATEQSNATITLMDGNGDDPGETISKTSRIVLLLTQSDGHMVPQNSAGELYVSDVVTHESTHLLMNENSGLYYGDSNPIDTWAVEGIAVAVEVLHRHADPESASVDYPEPDDPANISTSWLKAHVTSTMPTRDQLYNDSIDDRNDWYAVAGSVFLYLDKNESFDDMMTVAGQVYSANDQSPFQFFPDPKNPGSYLTPAAAKAAWLQWFQHRYEN